jgi:hypothetical protein
MLRAGIRWRVYEVGPVDEMITEIMQKNPKKVYSFAAIKATTTNEMEVRKVSTGMSRS